MILGGCVVLFNPNEAVLHNIGSYLPILDELVVVDNSTTKSPVAVELSHWDKVQYIDMKGNKGIASALNAGCSVLCEDGFDVALTMDQDSKFPLAEAEGIIAHVEQLIESYALVGLNFNADGQHFDSDVTEVKYWITSGNFLSLDAFNTVGGFCDDLFIDYVDFEFGHRLKLAGKKLCYLNRFSLSHEIGSPIEIKLFGRIFYAMNHSPLRYYYRYRNSRYLYGSDPAFYGDKYIREILVNIPKMLLFEPKKGEKLRMIHRGLADGRRGHLGPYSECD